MKQSKQVMPRYPLFEHIVASVFFEKYCPEVKNVKHKLRGIDGNRNAIDFSDHDKKLIKTGIKKLCKDLKEMSLDSGTF